MEEKRSSWLKRKPETSLEWMGIIFASIAFFMILSNVGVVMDAFKSITDVLAPFAAGVAIAYVVNPLVNASYKYICRSKPKLHWLAMLIGYLVAFLFVGALAYLILTQVITSLYDFVSRLVSYGTQLVNYVVELDAEHDWGLMELLGAPEDLMRKISEIQEWLQNQMEVDFKLSTFVSEFSTNLLAGVYDAVWLLCKGLVAGLTALASSVYLLLSKEKLLRQARILTRAFLPRRVAEKVLRICHDANRNLTGFFTGKIIDSAIIGVLTYVMMRLLKLQYPEMISIIVGVTNIIPVFGPFIGAVPGILVLLMAEPLQSLEFAVLILLIQQLDGNVIGPKILGDSIGISALWVLFSIVVGNAFFGLVGMVMGVPVFATIYSVIKEFAEWCLRRRGISKAESGERVKDEPRKPREKASDKQDKNDKGDGETGGDGSAEEAPKKKPLLHRLPVGRKTKLRG